MADPRTRNQGPNRILGQKEEINAEPEMLGDRISRATQQPYDTTLTALGASKLAEKVTQNPFAKNLSALISEVPLPGTTNQGANAVGKALGLGKNVAKFAGKGLGLPLLAYGVADESVKGLTGRGVSERIGEDLIAPSFSGVSGFLTGQSMNQDSLSGNEMDLIKRGLNPQKPIRNAKGNITGYEKVNPMNDEVTPNLSAIGEGTVLKNDQDSTAPATVVGDPNPVDSAAQTQALDGIRASLQGLQGLQGTVGGGDKPLMGVTDDGLVNVSPEQASQFSQQQKAQGTPTYSGIQDETYSEAVIDPTGQVSYMTPQDKAMFEEKATQQKVAQQERMARMIQDPAFQSYMQDKRSKEAADRAFYDNASVTREQPKQDPSPGAGKRFKDSVLRDAFGGGSELKKAKAKVKAGINPFTDKAFIDEESERQKNTAQDKNKFQEADDYLRKVGEAQGLSGEDLNNYVTSNIGGLLGLSGLPDFTVGDNKYNDQQNASIDQYMKNRNISREDAIAELKESGEL